MNFLITFFFCPYSLDNISFFLFGNRETPLKYEKHGCVWVIGLYHSSREWSRGFSLIEMYIYTEKQVHTCIRNIKKKRTGFQDSKGRRRRRRSVKVYLGRDIYIEFNLHKDTYVSEIQLSFKYTTSLMITDSSIGVYTQDYNRSIRLFLHKASFFSFRNSSFVCLYPPITGNPILPGIVYQSICCRLDVMCVVSVCVNKESHHLEPPRHTKQGMLAGICLSVSMCIGHTLCAMMFQWQTHTDGITLDNYL